MNTEQQATESVDEIDHGDLLGYLRNEEDMARQYQVDELQPDRTRNLDRLLGRPMGNEEENRSQVISTDVWDAIEGMLPSLLKPLIEQHVPVVFLRNHVVYVVRLLLSTSDILFAYWREFHVLVGACEWF